MSGYIFTAPEGAIKKKYYKISDGENFVEEAFLGYVNIGKSHALVDFIINRSLNYPGMRTILARDYLKMLKDTIAEKFAQRANKWLIGKDHSEVRYTFATDKCPYTGEDRNSKVDGWGLSQIGDIEDIFRGVEYGTSIIDEGNLIDNGKHDAILVRLRQRVFHKTLTVWDLSIKKALEWNVTPDEAFEIMFADPNHVVGQLGLTPDAPMPAPMIQKTAFNPKFQEPLWNRYIDAPYPKAITPEWVDKFVGVKEKYTPVTQVYIEGHIPYAGEEFIIKDKPITERYFCEYYDKHTHLVKLINVPQVVPAESLLLVKKRNTVFGFTHENESRNTENSSNMFLVEDESYRQSLTMGKNLDSQGMVFPHFINNFWENDGHIIRLTNNMMNTFRIGIGGLDKGGDHPHYICLGGFVKEIRGILVFDELLMSNITNIDASYYAKEMIPPHFIRTWWGYDPSMTHKNYNQSLEYFPLQDYYEALGEENLIKGVKGKDGYQILNKLLMYDNIVPNKAPLPRFLVSHKCEMLIDALEKLTWKIVQNSRNNQLTDIGDGGKYQASIVDQIVERETFTVSKFDISPNPVWRPQHSLPRQY